MNCRTGKICDNLYTYFNQSLSVSKFLLPGLEFLRSSDDVRQDLSTSSKGITRPLGKESGGLCGTFAFVLVMGSN